MGTGSVGKVQGNTECRDPEFQGQKIKNNFPVMVVETFNRVAELGCKLHTNAFGGRAPPGPAGEAPPDHPRSPSRYKAEGREGKRRKGLGTRMGRKGEWKDMKG